MEDNHDLNSKEPSFTVLDIEACWDPWWTADSLPSIVASQRITISSDGICSLGIFVQTCATEGRNNRGKEGFPVSGECLSASRLSTT